MKTPTQIANGINRLKAKKAAAEKKFIEFSERVDMKQFILPANLYAKEMVIIQHQINQLKWVLKS